MPTNISAIDNIFSLVICSLKNTYPVNIDITSGIASENIETIFIFIYFIINILTNNTIKNNPYPVITYILIYSDIILSCFCIADFFNKTCENEANSALNNNKTNNNILFITFTHNYNTKKKKKHSYYHF